jgi:hypothetical protein
MKNFLVILLAGLILGSSVLPAQALEVVIHSNGTVSFYETPQILGEVLGDEDVVSSDEEDREADKKKAELARELAKKRLEAEREKMKTVRSTLSDKKTEIRVKTDGDKARVLLETKRASESGKPRSPRIEEVKSGESVRLELPAQLKTTDDEGEAEAIKEIRLERKERIEEKVELRSESDENGETRLELRSGETKATLRNGEVLVNPQTNDVSITAADGVQTRRLNHLPDQAIARIKELIELRQNADGSEPEVEIETTDDGEVLYTTETLREKRLFGLFKREVQTRVELNDSTGEVTETEIPAVSAWERFLNRFAR